MRDCRCYPAEKDGNGYVQWIGSYMADCVWTDVEQASFYVGMSSIAFWVACQFPQMYKNFKRGSADALSVWFLLEWLSGDTFNLVGCLLTNQLPTQIYTAFLFAFQDSLMLSQYTYYHFKNRKTAKRKAALLQKEKDLEDARHRDSVDSGLGSGSGSASASAAEPLLGSPSNDAAVAHHTGYGSSASSTDGTRSMSVAVPLIGLSMAGVLGWAALSGGDAEVGGFSASPATLGHGTSRVLLAYGTEVHTDACDYVAPSKKWEKTTGTILGWISSVLYLNSRLPQLYKNYKRGSVEGLSWVMFSCAVLGNLSYVLGILMKIDTHAELMNALAWLPGSAGTLLLDLCILCQYMYYKRKRSRRRKIWAAAHLGPASTVSPDTMALLSETPKASPNLPRGVHDIVDWTTSPMFGNHERPIRVGKNKYVAGSRVDEEEQERTRHTLARRGTADGANLLARDSSL